jgi:CRP-like cAMP-binding protein
LSEGDVSRLKSARSRQVALRAKRLLVREGESTSEVYRLHSGWGIRFRTVASGERQILSFDLPGDFLTPELLCGTPARFSKTALTAMTLCAFPREPTSNAVFADPQKADFVEKLLVRRIRDAEDRIMMLGRLSAAGRIAALVLDTFRRLSRRGMTDGREIEFPLRHEDLADALGLTPEHVSRTLAALRASELLEIRSGRAAVLDREGLHRLAS